VIMMSITAITILISPNPLFQISVMEYVANLFIFSKFFGEPFVDGAYWSIVLEVIFYGWIFIIITMGQFQNIIRIIPFWLGFSFLNEIYIGSTHLQNLLITEHSGFFAMGIVLHRLRKEFSYYAIVVFLIALACSIYTSTAGIAWSEEAYSVEFSAMAITAIILSSIVVFLMLTRVKISQRYWRSLSILGGSTYALYLVHQNVGYIAITRLLDKCHH